MLDSSPVALPPIPRPLKRSASTASLPTPPRHRKHARGRSRGSCDSSSDEDVVLTGDEALPLLYRRRQAQVDVAPLSPPPSHRRPAVTTPKAFPTRKPEPRIATDSPPVTPKTRSSARLALRDSPDNPFLATPENHVEDTPSPSNSSANPSPHGSLKERPTIAYVLYVFYGSCVSILIFFFYSRGVRRECKNPLYNHAQGRPFSPPPESKLSIDHPDYSPAIHCTPKRLFAGVRSKRKKPVASNKQDPPSRKRARQRSPSLSADEGDLGEIRPLKLDFGPKKGAGAQTVDQKVGNAGESTFS